jgi:CMP-N-acetylneuraminic acid synthetase
VSAAASFLSDVGPVLCLIPAKGGSTRLPRKNVCSLGGKTLLEWTVQAARTAGTMDRIVVSTEDEEVAEIVRKLGIEVPFLRPSELARDPAGVVDVALHAISALRKQGGEYRTLVILLPTCPFRTSDDIRGAFALYQGKGASSLMSVSAYPHTPFAALKFDGDCLMPWFPEYLGLKSQEMPAAFRANGAIHILEVSRLEREKSYYKPPVLGYVMPPERSIDIDTADDLRQAELMLELGRVGV